ncbi:MAG TPA: hypothetical protein VMF12_11165 [Xanthobacteraceae bacterium]|nr:hypothetical protein [Xanthobacteraceae bacterium]
MASSDPTVHAFGSRAQNPRRSCTVSVAAESASAAPTAFVEGLRCAPPLGNRISTTLSQNAIRNRKNMSPVFPAAKATVARGKLAGSAESCVRWVGLFLPIIEENTPQIFEQFDKN